MSDDACVVAFDLVEGIGQSGTATQAAYNILKKRAKNAGVRDFSPHDLQWAFVSDMLSRGADIVLGACIAGHVNVTTAARYDRRPEEAKRAAASLLHYPFESR